MPIITIGVLALGAYFLFIHKDEIIAGIKSGGAPAAAAAAAPAVDIAAPDVAVAPAPSPSPASKYVAPGGKKARGYKPPKGGYTAPKGGYTAPKGGYIGTPGWYTFAGHHHCNASSAGCVCTDPKKCCRTGYPPTDASRCRPDKGRYGAGPLSLCDCAKPYYGQPQKSTGGAVKGGGGKGGKYKGNMARSYFAIPGDDSEEVGVSGVPIKVGYYDATLFENGTIDYDDPGMIQMSHERMSIC